MSNRIPPSLAWLIDKRARIDGEMKKTEESLQRLTRLLIRLEAAEKRLVALDAMIAAHPLVREPKKIGVFITEHNRRLPLQKGEMTHCILECLKEASGTPVMQTHLLAFVFERYPQFETTEYYRRWIWEVIKDRLKTLVRRGVVLRHHDRRTFRPGAWSLSPGVHQ